MKLPIALLVLVVGLALGSACRRAPVAGGPAPAARVEGDTIQFDLNSSQLRLVRVERASEESSAPVALTGRLGWNEDRTARLAPPVAGRIVTLAASVGTRVRRGALLAEVSSPDFGQAQSEAAKAAADASASVRNRDRIAALYERGAAPRKDLEAAESDVVRARAEAARTAARLTKWGGTLSSAPDQLYRMRAPLDGVVVERNANPGLEVRPDSPNPVFLLSDVTSLWVLLDLAERDLSGVAEGNGLKVRTGAYPGRLFQGRLDVVGEALDPATRMVKARGTVENPGGLLKAEMYVMVEVEGQKASRSTVIPARSILTEGGKRFCFVEVGPARFRRVPVAVGVEHDGKVPVSGLSRDSRVVTEGGLLLSMLLPSSADVESR
jgi:membrane fusion protein, heavy metal efflux system